MVAALGWSAQAGKPKPRGPTQRSSHPQLDHSRATRGLMNAAARLDPARVQVRDLYALYPDYFIDVATEQAQLLQAHLVVWLHPVQW